MKILIVDTYYPSFLAWFYGTNSAIQRSAYDAQIEALVDQCFGTADFYSRHLNALGCEVQDLIVNCAPLQTRWARENQFSFQEWSLRIPHRAYRIPLLGNLLARLPGLLDIAIEQVKTFAPDILYCQDLSFFPPGVLNTLKEHAKLIVGQIACPLPPSHFLQPYDLILTSFPHYVPRLRQLGIASEYFRIGFDSRVLEKLGAVEKNLPVSFVGGISRNHGKAISTLEYLADATPIEFFGYGASILNSRSPILRKHHGEVWGLDMYRVLARSQVTLNRHIDVAENNANNMRLYEATGVGALLITDRKDNLGELFAADKEVVVYSSREEAAELIKHYLANPEEAIAIAKAGQLRTLSEHTYAHRMRELVPILKRYYKESR
ncbi:MAG: glycosyltransferase [Betaproteobacteria bacterium]|nr:glycosyltransferase [Betaproteobacteria bacterium]